MMHTNMSKGREDENRDPALARARAAEAENELLRGALRQLDAQRVVPAAQFEALTAERDGHMLQHLDALADAKRLREEIYRLRGALDDLAQRVEDDRREPDKLLCHVQSARHVLIIGPRGTRSEIEGFKAERDVAQSASFQHSQRANAAEKKVERVRSLREDMIDDDNINEAWLIELARVLEDE